MFRHRRSVDIARRIARRIARGTAPDRVFSTVGWDARHADETCERRQHAIKAKVIVVPTPG